MRSIASTLLPAAAAALAVTTVSTAALPTGLAEAPPPRSTGTASSTGLADSTGAAPSRGIGGLPGARAGVPPSGLDGAYPLSRPTLAPRGRWAWPLAPRPPVVRPFVRPVSTWGAGHRGVDLGSAAGAEVRAVDEGVVGHVGVVAGRGTITVLHRSGLRSTYEPVDADVETGDVVRRGQRLGTLTEGGHCSPASCLHLGALRGEAYLDPLTLLGATRVRLLPLP